MGVQQLPPPEMPKRAQLSGILACHTEKETLPKPLGQRFWTWGGQSVVVGEPVLSHLNSLSLGAQKAFFRFSHAVGMSTDIPVEHIVLHAKRKVSAWLGWNKFVDRHQLSDQELRRHVAL